MHLKWKDFIIIINHFFFLEIRLNQCTKYFRLCDSWDRYQLACDPRENKRLRQWMVGCLLCSYLTSGTRTEAPRPTCQVLSCLQARPSPTSPNTAHLYQTPPKALTWTSPIPTTFMRSPGLSTRADVSLFASRHPVKHIAKSEFMFSVFCQILM